MWRAALPAVLLTLGATMAQAQPAPSPPPAQQSPSAPDAKSNNSNSNQAACPPEAGANAPTVGSGQSGGNLSDKLANSNGVICPPAGVDPQMHVPAPQEGRMPVIPPPGTPGGDQKTIPK